MDDQDEQSTKPTLQRGGGVALVALGAVFAIYGATLSAPWSVIFIALGVILIIGGAGVLTLTRGRRLDHGNVRRTRIWLGGVLIAFGGVFLVSGLLSRTAPFTAEGAIAVLFGVFILYTVTRASRRR